MTYNKNDWTLGGWVHFLEGYTIYLSSVDDLAFSPTDGILVSDVSRGIPIVTIREERHILRWDLELISNSDWSTALTYQYQFENLSKRVPIFNLLRRETQS